MTLADTMLPWRRRPAGRRGLSWISGPSAGEALAAVSERSALPPPRRTIRCRMVEIRPPVMPSTTGCLYGFGPCEFLPRMSLNSMCMVGERRPTL